MLDFAYLTNNPSNDIQYFTGNIGNWFTWKKPRGAKLIYMFGVGGGASGGCGINTGVSSGGGAGGASGMQTSLVIPAFFVPDILYVQCGAGGKQPTVLVSGALGVAGSPTFVNIVPDSSQAGFNSVSFLYAAGANATVTAPTTTAGGGTGTAVTTLIQFQWLGLKGMSNPIQNNVLGTAGGTSTGAGVSLSYYSATNTFGNSVLGGSGGGGSSATPGAGGGITSPGGSFSADFLLPTTAGGAAASGATPAGDGAGGFKSRNQILNFGGYGGGGASTTAGGVAGRGGDGAPGCGGGGAGGSNTTNPTLARPGNGGDGFVYIVSV